jgi:hypothetical protein
MVLHRDIFWVGRQWAVTGYGIQACNQKQKGQFDIEGARLWEDSVLESIRAEPWLNVEDFEKALEVARKHYPEPPPPKPAPPEPNIPDLQEPAVKEISSREIPAQEIYAEASKPAPLIFELHINGWPAKFVRPWRVRTRR